MTLLVKASNNLPDCLAELSIVKILLTGRKQQTENFT
jgi:hypothetical protein